MSMVQSTSITSPLVPAQVAPVAPTSRPGAARGSSPQPVGDTVTISEEARQLAQGLAPTVTEPALDSALGEAAIAPPSVEDATLTEGIDSTDPESKELQWGPDLTAGWNDAAYLKMQGEGYTGSLSFTTKNGTKIGVAAGPAGEDGKPSSELTLTAQTADGTLYEQKMGDFLCITEDENGISFTETNRGFDGKDNIMFTTKKDSVLLGGDGNGNDTLISLTSAALSGGAGDDTLVSLGTVDNHNKINVSRGNKSVYMRTYDGDRLGHALDIGYNSNNTINIDYSTKSSEIDISGIGSWRHEKTTLNIKRADGTMNFKDGDITANINDFRGAIVNGDAGEGNVGFVGKTTLNIAKANGGYIISDDGHIEFNIGAADSLEVLTTDTKYSGKIGDAKNCDIMFSEGSSGSLSIANAEWCTLFGSGITVGRLENSILTDNRDIYATARVFGILRAKEIFEGFDAKNHKWA